MRNFYRGVISLGACFFVQASYAGSVSILNAKITRSIGQEWSASVTLKHDDEGLKHYADAWRIVNSAGKVLATRTLYHPHDTEQPFTRSLGGIKIPENISTIYIEAHDKVHGWSKQRLQVNLNHVLGQSQVVNKPVTSGKSTKGEK